MPYVSNDLVIIRLTIILAVTTPGGPSGLPARKKRTQNCMRGLTSCFHYSGRGGWDCIDTQSDAESCGGCVGPDALDNGEDCTAIPNVNVVNCVKSKCMIGAFSAVVKSTYR